jgi:NTP pyrophosphatase (non-canonical NTP hydrolase)
LKKYSYNDYQAITRETTGCDDLTVLALGLIGETIEFLDAVDKIYDGSSGLCLLDAAENALKESGDVLWYAARIMDVLEIKFGDWERYSAGTADNCLDPCHTNFHKKFRMAKNAAEVSEHIKKVFGHGHDLDKNRVCNHVSDIIRDILHILKNIYGDCSPKRDNPLMVSMLANVEKLRKRYPNGFEIERSKNRQPDDV